MNRYSRQDLVLIGVGLLMTVVAAGTGEANFGVWFFGFCTVALVITPLLSRATAGQGGHAERVEFDEHAIRRYSSNGKIEEITWPEIDEIGILTTAEGPWVEDVFWLFLNKDHSKGCAVPNNAAGFNELLPRIQRFPGFDNEMVVKAMGSTSEARFVVWKKTGSQ